MDMEEVMKGLILAAASALALGGVTPAQAQIYYPDYSSYSSYTVYPRYTVTPEAPRYPGTAYRTRGQVVQAQLALRRDGLYHGKIDGIIGPRTRQALRDYQSRHGLPVTAGLDAATTASLFGIAPASQGPSYRGTGMP